MKVIIYSILCLLLLGTTCRKDHCSDPTPIYVYKTKADYSEKVSVGLSKDKSRVVAAPGPGDINNDRQYKTGFLVDGYYLNGIFGGGHITVFLSVDKTDYATWPKYPGADSLYKLIIDFDPFTELYFNCGDIFLLDLERGGLDTTRINQIIKDGELNKYFKKLK